eukprot:GEMP01063585.1.p1 GENE.GEMP01063585.1~~GEMP01063585.1.p1  ORF type:complete len:103 (+),score=19.49 GEMP01063585.1:191-499(+)
MQEDRCTTQGKRVLGSQFPNYQNKTVRYVGFVHPDCMEGVDGHKIPNCVDSTYQNLWVEVLAQVVGQGLGPPKMVCLLGNVDPKAMLTSIQLTHKAKYTEDL